MESGSEFKTVLNRAVVEEIATALHTTLSTLNTDAFVSAVMTRLNDLELKDRAYWIAENIRHHLPEDVPTALQHLIRSPDHKPDLTFKPGFGGFFYMPHTCFVERYGLDHYEESMDAMFHLTQRFTAEFAIRPFITRYPEATMKQLMAWTTHDNEHVRRLVSEGTRPRLPWASRLPQFQDDPTPVIALLERLKTDPELYVRRSVANNLNDIAKDNPERVISTLTEWSQSPDMGTQWIIGHALRSLVKQGHPDALSLLGYPPNPRITVSPITLKTSSLSVGDTLEFSVDIASTASTRQELMIDYTMYFMKANGKQAPKVFKIKKAGLEPGHTLSVTHRKTLKQATTRKLYPGTHRIELLINGTAHHSASFELSL